MEFYIFVYKACAVSLYTILVREVDGRFVTLFFNMSQNDLKRPNRILLIFSAIHIKSLAFRFATPTYVYLPYGYDEASEQPYNVFYFVHGHGETAISFFQNENGLLCKLLDHMLENRDMAPTLIVSTSYVYGTPVDYYPDADPYCEALPQELVNDLIPLIESRYHTYTESTDVAGITVSRKHRAIGGFSMGAVTVWYALEHALECFKYFMPISSDGWSLGRFAGMTNPDETAEYLANTIRNSAFSKNDFYIWACSGTNDVAYDRIWSQVQAMAQLTDVFSVSNLTFHEQDGARHEFRSLAEYLYNVLPFMFPNQ